VLGDVSIQITVNRSGHNPFKEKMGSVGIPKMIIILPIALVVSEPANSLRWVKTGGKPTDILKKATKRNERSTSLRKNLKGILERKG